MSIFEEIRDSAEGRELSERWYRFKVKQMMGTRGSFRGVMADADTERRKSIPKWGNMNLFWYRPKTAKKLPYYDVFPIVLPFKKHRDGFTGINFHYLPIYMRIKLLNLLDAGFGDEDKGRLQVFWNDLRNLKLAKPIVRRYLAPNVHSLFLHISLEDMFVATLLPVEKFYKGEYKSKRGVSSRVVWNDIKGIMYGT